MEVATKAGRFLFCLFCIGSVEESHAMPAPTSSLATLRPDLATFCEFDLESEKNGYIATEVFPVVDVASQAGTFGIIPIEQLLQQRDTKRSSGSGYARGKFTFDDAVYATREYGAEEVIDDRQAKMYANYFDAEKIATMRAFSAVLRNGEQRVADAVFNSTTWTISGTTASTPGQFGAAIVNEWDDFAAATPIADVEVAVNKIYSNSGLWANAMVINRHVFRNLRQCAQVIARIESAGAGSPSSMANITVEMLKAVFDLEHIIVAGTSKNGANEGQSAAPSQIWSPEYAWIGRISTSADMSDPCVGRTFHWSADGSSIGGTVETYRDEAVRGDVTRVRHEVAEVLLYKEAGYLLSNATTI